MTFNFISPYWLLRLHHTPKTRYYNLIMTSDSLEIFLNWMTQNTVWVNIFIFLTAMSESLLVVGLIVPGFLLMLGFGALIATGHLEFWPTVIIAIAGAIAGDGLSYWLGQHYKLQLQRIWPLSRYPGLVKQGQAFFNKHGKKSVVLGRFFGPLRAIVPTIAGMSDMPAKQFYFSNVLSALAWAPLYLLPGILFGMSLQLAREFAGQLVFLLIIVIISGLLAIHLVKTLYNWLAPQADVLSYRLIIWARKHPVLGVLPDSLVNPEHSEVRAISSFGVLLVLSSLSLVVFNYYFLDSLFLNNLDIFIATQTSLLLHPVATSIAAVFNIFNYHYFILSSVALFTVVQLYLKNVKAVLFLIAALVLPWLLLLIHNRFSLSFNAFNRQNLDASHLFIVAVSVYGFITTWLTRNDSATKSRIIYSLAFLFISTIALAQLYSGHQTFSSLIGQFLFALIWVAILSIAYRRHPSVKQTNTGSLLTVKLITVTGLGLVAFIFFYNFNSDNAYHSREKKNDYIISHQGWLESGWKILPAFRNDLRGNRQYPLNIQWVSSQKNIIETLNTSNWQQVNNSIDKYSNWLKQTSNPAELPVVKHLHNGRYNNLGFVKTTENNRLLVIRLWQSRYFSQSNDLKQRLWYGEIVFTKITRAPFLNYLTSENRFNGLMTEFTKDLAATYELRSRHTNDTLSNWDGKVILIM